MYSIRRIAGKLAQLHFIKKSYRRKPIGKVLMMHGIAEEKEEFTISPSEFEVLLRFLSDKKVIRLEEWEKQNDFYALTFDDVTESFYQNGFPLLKQYKIPYTIFVNTSLLDTEGFITTEQLKVMAASDLCTVGSHGTSHTQYHLFNKEQAREDLRNSRNVLEGILGKPVEMFAFPYGSYSACGFKNKYMAGDIFKYGFGTVACPITVPATLPKYFLPRINIESTYINTLR